MTAYTASVSGLWSNAATWGGAGTPSVNADTFVINSGVVVEMDVDLSALANGLGASTINGTLFFSRTAGAYYLKMNGTLTVSTTGTLDASDGSGGAYPATCTATILLNGNFSITVSGSGVVNLICGEPTNKYVKLSAAEALGQTTLSVDTDVTADALWAAGALVRIDNINLIAQSEERTLDATITATTLDITVGLTAAKLEGAYVILVSRNVKILGASTAGGIGISGGTGGVIGAEIRNLNVGCSGFVSPTLNGTISGCTTALLSSSSGATVNAMISGCTTGDAAGSGHHYAGLISGCATALNSDRNPLVVGIISGCTIGLNSCAGGRVTGSIVNCGSGAVNCGGLQVQGATFSNNAQDLNQVNKTRLINTLLGSTNEFLNYNSAAQRLENYVESLDHDQVAGAFRAWTRGGITSSVASPVYDASRPRSYNAVCESASFPAFFQRQALVPAGGSLFVRCYARKDASMSYLPRVWIFSAEKEPLLAGTPDAEVTMDAADTVDTWEVLEATVTNATAAPKLYTVRMLAKNASGNAYFDPIIRVSSYSTPLGMEAA